jgi:hypothetical protein
MGGDYEERFEKYSGQEYIKFDRIPESDRLHPDRTLCGYLKVYELLNPEQRQTFSLCAGHDEVWLPLPEGMTDADIVYLLRCGIGYDAGTASLHDFV